MNKKRHAERILPCIFMWYAILPTVPIGAGQSEPMAVGRENPFAEITRPKMLQTPAAILASSNYGEGTPELVIATVKLKSLDAQTLSSVIEGMCSPYGSVSADTKNNSLIICDSSEVLARILAQVNKVDGTTPEQMFIETANLKFLDAESLTESLQRMLSPYGSVTVNKSTNSLIISDTEESLSRILSEIERADKTPRQIMVEVVIIDVQLNDDTEMGINWDFLTTSNKHVQYRQSFEPSRLGTTAPTATSIIDNTAFNTTGLGGNFSVITGTIRNVVGLLQQKRNVEILASPRAMMVSGQSASIKAVEEIPYSEVSDTAAGGAGAITSTKFKDVGITLEVTGTITDGNNIFLTLNAQQSVQTGTSGGVPEVDAREVDTSLMLKDGQIVVMGGLRRQEKINQANQIPILGDIPLVGLLFKYTSTVFNNTELIVLVSPHIYKEGEPIPEDAMAKFNEIRDKPMLSLPEEAKLKEHNEKFEQHVEQQTAALKQLQLDIAKSERAEAELIESRARLEEHIKGQTSTSKQLQQDLAKCKQEEVKLKENSDEFEQRAEQHTAAIEQLRLKIAESERAEAELKESRARLEKDLKGQASTSEQLQQDLVKCRQAQNELREQRDQIEQSLEQQTATDKQLHSQSRQDKAKEAELGERRKQLKQRLEQQTAAVEQLQLKIRRQAERDATKKMLLGRIKVLQTRNDEDAVKELLTTLHSLDEILGQEIKEALNSSAKNVADSGK